jgi:hypothetical protein
VSHLAAGTKLVVDNGRERRTDGLLKHLGIGDFGSLRSVDNQTTLIKTGSGTEVLFDRPAATGYLQAVDRDANVLRDLIIQARNITLVPNPGSLFLPAGCVGTAQIQANAVQQLMAQYNAAPGWNTSVLNTWLETVAVTPNATYGGYLCRFEVTVNYSCTTGGTVYWGVTTDHAITWPSMAVQSVTPTEAKSVSFVMYGTPSAGVHSFGIATYVATGPGTLNITSAAYTSLYVTEQRR